MIGIDMCKVYRELPENYELTKILILRKISTNFSYLIF